MNNQELRDAERKAGFIDRNSALYAVDPIFKDFVDRTIYITADQRHASDAEVGRLFGMNTHIRHFLGASHFETNA